MQSEIELFQEKDAIERCLQNYGIEYEDISCISGPTYNLYKLKLRPGVRVSKVKSLQSDISVSLNRQVRIVTLPDSVGLEIAHPDSRDIVEYKSLDPDCRKDCILPIMLGKTIDGKVLVEDLTQMPHLLVAGATKQGKTNAIRVMIASLLQSQSPEELKFALIDPKHTELECCRSLLSRGYLAVRPDYSSPEEEKACCIAHTGMEALSLLSSLESEMLERYDALAKHSLRNIESYHSRFETLKAKDKNLLYYPYIVTVIDEYADYISTKQWKPILRNIIRLAQKGRAVGIHLVLCTQRPCVDVITGVIKANFPTRLAFRTSSHIDSMTILDTSGSELLTGKGDALFSEGLDCTRLQVPLLKEEELEQLIQSKGQPLGGDNIPYYLPSADNPVIKTIEPEDLDPLFKEAAITVVVTQQGSASFLQRKLDIGFARASKLLDQLEAHGIVSEIGATPRKVLISSLKELRKKVDFDPDDGDDTLQ